MVLELTLTIRYRPASSIEFNDRDPFLSMLCRLNRWCLDAPALLEIGMRGVEARAGLIWLIPISLLRGQGRCMLCYRASFLLSLVTPLIGGNPCVTSDVKRARTRGFKRVRGVE